jgi:hypothetical protein
MVPKTGDGFVQNHGLKLCSHACAHKIHTSWIRMRQSRFFCANDMFQKEQIKVDHNQRIEMCTHIFGTTIVLFDRVNVLIDKSMYKYVRNKY